MTHTHTHSLSLSLSLSLSHTSCIYYASYSEKESKLLFRNIHFTKSKNKIQHQILKLYSTIGYHMKIWRPGPFLQLMSHLWHIDRYTLRWQTVWHYLQHNSNLNTHTTVWAVLKWAKHYFSHHKWPCIT